MKNISASEQKKLVELFYKIGTLYHQGIRLNHYTIEQRRTRFFKGIYDLGFQIWNEVVKREKESFTPVTMVLPNRSEQKIALRFYPDKPLDTDPSIRGYKLELLCGKCKYTRLGLYFSFDPINPENHERGITSNVSVMFDEGGGNPNEIIIQQDGSTDEDASRYEDQFIDQWLGFFLTELLIPATF